MSDMRQMLIVGCGNMGGAMLAGWLKSGMSPDRFAILDPALESAPDGVALYREPDAAKDAGSHDCVLLGFKPQQLGKLGPGLQDITGGGVAVHSLLAGLTLDHLRNAFPAARAHVRVMPNLAARINRTPVILLESGLSPDDRGPVLEFYDALGTATWLEEEAKFDLVTALAGSGPGFVYRFIDALAQAATSLGLERSQADKLALTMVDGASSLAADADISAGELADRVASPGGMTREGMNVLDADAALVNLLIDTLAATRDRGAQLAAGGD